MKLIRLTTPDGKLCLFHPEEIRAVAPRMDGATLLHLRSGADLRVIAVKESTEEVAALLEGAAGSPGVSPIFDLARN